MASLATKVRLYSQNLNRQPSGPETMWPAESSAKWAGRISVSVSAWRLPAWYCCTPNTVPPEANFNDNFTYNGSPKGQYRNGTVAVGSFAANGFGLHDMHGNV